MLNVNNMEQEALNDMLRWAAKYEYIEIINLLLEHGADVHAYNDWALCLASENGHINVVKLLLEHKADIHAYDDWALCYSTYHGHIEVVKLLLEHGANVHARNDLALLWSRTDEIKALLRSYA